MAEVLITNFIQKSMPKTGACGVVSYNNKLYINYTDSIYEYDAINDIMTLKITKGVSTDYNCVIYNDKMYFVKYVNPGSSGAIRVYEYNITTNQFTTFTNITYNEGSRYTYDTIYWYTIFLQNNLLYIAMAHNIWSFGSQIYHTYRALNLDTKESSTISPAYYLPRGGQISNLFYFYKVYNSTDEEIFNNYGSLNNGVLTDIGTSVSPFYRLNGSFYRNGKIYYIGSDSSKLLQYDVSNNTFTDLGYIDNSEHTSFPKKYFGNVDNNYYLMADNGIWKISFIDYNLNYKIANNSGDNIYVELKEQSPITKIRFNYNLGNEQVGYVMTTLTGDVTGSYTPNIPDGYKLIGFGYSPNASSSSVIGPLNTDITVSIDSDFTFYEVYGIYRPPGTTFDINLYQNTSEGNRVDKTNYLTQVGNISGALRSSTSINDLVITYESKSVPNFNYVYIPIFNRYYFVDDITSENYSLWTLALSVDPLMTYKEAIINCNGFVDRCESDFNANIIDKKRVVEEGNTIEVDTVTNELFTNTSGTYIMTALLVGFDSIEE